MSCKAFQTAVVLAMPFSTFPATVLSTSVSLPSTGSPAQMDTQLLIATVNSDDKGIESDCAASCASR
jgi:hypothetical protein